MRLLFKRWFTAGFSVVGLLGAGLLGVGLFNAASSHAQPAFVLSATEKQYIEQNPIVDVASIQQYRPFYAVSAAGQADGITFDYLARVAALTGLKFNPRVFSTFAQAKSAVQTSGNAAWAALSTSGMRSLNLPCELCDIIVLADGDDPGEVAAQVCAMRWRRVRMVTAVESTSPAPPIAGSVRQLPVA